MRSFFGLRSSTTLLVKTTSDAAIFALAYTFAFYSRVDSMADENWAALMWTLPIIVAVKLMTYAYFGSYRSIWRYCGLRDLQSLSRAALTSCAVLLAIGFLLPQSLSLPRSIPFIDMAFALLMGCASRSTVRLVHESSHTEGNRELAANLLGTRPRRKSRRVLVVGAGDGGEMVVREMFRNRRMDYDPIAFVDDNPKKLGQRIHGVPVLGKTADIPRLVSQHNVKEILIAIPSARGRDVRAIVEVCRNTPAIFKIVPDLSRIEDGRIQLADLRDVEVEDLLGRETARLDLSMISAYLRGKRILVTGAGGSIGSELCRQILKFGPAEIQLMGRGENSIFEIHREIARHAGFTRLVQIIGDVINKKKLEGIFAMYRPQIVFHAGADKHVPLMEMNPDEAVFNNVVGTKNVLEVADAYRVERVVCISTDKAVNPTSVMGCCKRVAELLIRSKMYHNTIAVAVRFGNVLGSRGSVIPHFKKQIEHGGPITVTHRDIRRFFMTIPEAAGLVIQAGAMGKGGEIFVLDMGEPVKIWDLAENMVRLTGLEPGRDIEIHETGLRPGEKLDEELSFDYESLLPTSHPKITCVEGEGLDRLRLLAEIKNLTDKALRMDFAGIRAGLRRVVPEYLPYEEPEAMPVPIAVGGTQ
jgi:FlaA1/EpsC-like NDP-sugar epimerase